MIAGAQCWGGTAEFLAASGATMRGAAGFYIARLILVSGLALWFAACSKSAPAVDQPRLSIRQIVATTNDELFVKGTEPRNIAVGPDRVFDTVLGPQRGACLRASVIPLLGNGSRSTVTYVVLADGEKIVDRRPALQEDQCTKEPFEVVQRKPQGS